jgi:2,5-diamino-6-(ribosylamino)-4(3H)-pyrimidinone 5'-phosphate reductase
MKKPYVFINCAMSIDGKLAHPTGTQIRISCDEDIKRMYELRNKTDAVLVGINTVLSDDPKLTVKKKYVKYPKKPIRVVLDSNCRTPMDALVVNDAAKTFIVVGKECDKKFADNVEIIECQTNKDGMIDLEDLMTILVERGIKKLMVEGGGIVIGSFLESGLVDDIYIYVGPIVIGGISTPYFAKSIGKDIINLELVDFKKIGPGILLHYRLIK